MLRDIAPGAALTERGTSLGTPAYMAPEQVAGEETMDYRVDIYAWGMLAHEMLAGERVAELVRRCVAKSPDDRPQHATELLRALDAATPRRLGRGLRNGLLVGVALAVAARVTAVLIRPGDPHGRSNGSDHGNAGPGSRCGDLAGRALRRLRRRSEQPPPDLCAIARERAIGDGHSRQRSVSALAALAARRIAAPVL